MHVQVRINCLLFMPWLYVAIDVLVRQWSIMFTRCIIYFFHNKEKEEGVCQYIQKRTIIEKKNEARMFMTKQVI